MSGDLQRPALRLLDVDECPAALADETRLLQQWAPLVEQSRQRLSGHGDFNRWWKDISTLSWGRCTDWGPVPRATLSKDGLRQATRVFRGLMPWKKGPFQLTDGQTTTEVDGEWDCRLKWNRVLELGPSLRDRRVLDVGTGNGYYLFRIREAGASYALGLEPSVLFACQFAALQRLFAVAHVGLLPLRDDQFVDGCQAFDTVLSMGVLYHRKDPLQHLRSLRGFLRPGGQLVLETIVVPGDEATVLRPTGRYAQMRNVHGLPTVATLESWLRQTGFDTVRTGAVVPTTSREQRSTEWTKQPSLTSFLDENDPSRTKEGHPAPRRVVVVADHADP